MARPTNTEQRQAQIVRGLIKVMAKRGYDGASISDIAKSARLSPGVVHYHFKSKHEILLAVLHTLAAEHDRQLRAKLEPLAGDPLAAIAAFIDFHLAVGADANPQTLACWILLSGEALRDAKIRVEFEKALVGTRDYLASFLRAGVDQQLLDCAEVEASASALIAVVQGYYVLATTTQTMIAPGSAAGATKLMAQGMLKPVRPFQVGGLGA